MNKLYLLNVDPAFTQEVSEHHEIASEAILSAFSTSDEAVAASQKFEDSSSVIVLGSGLAEPIQTLQRLHTVRPDLIVIVLCEADKFEYIKKSILFTPFIGKNVRVISSDDISLIAQEIRLAFYETSQRHHYRKLVQATNRELLLKSSKSAGDPERSKQIFFDRILESAPIGIASVDAHGKILSWNNGARDILDRTELQMLGVKFTEVFQNIETQRTLRLHFERASSPIEFRSVPVVFPRVNRNCVDQYLEVTVASITGNQNDRGSVVIFQDVTDRVNANLAKNEKELQLEEAIQVRDEFLSIASHELKTPLTPLKLQLQILARSLKNGQNSGVSESQITKIISVCDKQIARLTRLIDDLLDVARISGKKLTLNFESIDFIPFCTETINQFQGAAELAGSSIKVEIGSEISIQGDQLRLEQVISNLITNAIKFCDRKPIEVWVGKKENFAILQIRDFGIGIDKNDIDRIFERYERVPSASNVGGLGLGLYISRQIIRAHNGEINVRNIAPRGAIFTVHLPI